jgi:hypothetical protein
MTKQPILLAVALIALVSAFVAGGLVGAESAVDKEPTRLAVVWTSGDPDVAHKMAFMYVHASQKRGWFDENLVIVWGPSSRLLAGDKELQAKIAAMMEGGVKFQACVACADMYGVAPKLRELGIEVKPMGEPLTRLLQDDGWEVMTY